MEEEVGAVVLVQKGQEGFALEVLVKVVEVD